MNDRITLRDAWGNLAVTLSCKAIVRSGDKLWLRKNERGDWELPGGRLEEGEQPEQTIEREIREELGLEVDGLQLLDVYVWQKDFGTTTHVELVTFVCNERGRVGDFEHMGEGGLAEFRQFTVNDALLLDNLPEPYKRALRRL